MKNKVTAKAAEKKAAPKKATTKACKCCKAKAAPAKSVVFTLHEEKGRKIYLAGDFNEWSTTAKKMTYKAKTGVYSTTVKLACGTYEYKFLIDGKWCADPQNVNCVANDKGTFNSVITVS